MSLGLLVAGLNRTVSKLVAGWQLARQIVCGLSWPPCGTARSCARGALHSGTGVRRDRRMRHFWRTRPDRSAPTGGGEVHGKMMACVSARPTTGISKKAFQPKCPAWDV